ncbi:MAG: COX15/CtaA family protein [Balneolaceae bacterium]|nr:COX15/CtaA family protein [Balneolaceae bacterium]
MHTGNRYVRRWLWSGAILIFLMVIIGGITRLTGSGLSMSDWSLIMGAVPPMNPSEWNEAFEQYKQFPQYRQLNEGMSLPEFKQKFFWEYVHRLLGRLIGLVFLLPFLFFWIRGYFSKKMRNRALILFALGGLQGAMGWIMVKSGLVDVPYVSHYRLALHLLLAFILVSFCTWYALDLYERRPKTKSGSGGTLNIWAWATASVFTVQLIWGAFTAGLDAGYIYNTFPLMNGEWLPQNAWNMQPVLVNLLENPGTVQWVHRIVGTLLLLLVAGLWFRTINTPVKKSLPFKAGSLLLLIVIQYLLGVFTVLYQVPVSLGVLHQGFALIFWVGWVFYYHDLHTNYRTKKIP